MGDQSTILNPKSPINILPLLAVGFLSILVQAVMLRELSVAYYGVELIYTLAIACWLLWTAAGSLIGRRAAPSPPQLAFLFALSAVLLPFALAFIRGIRVIFAPAPGAYMPFSLQVVSMACSLLPVGLLFGLQFQWAAKLFVAQGKTLALAYAIESAGGLVGGLSATWLLKAGVGSVTTILICALLAMSLAYCSLARTGKAWIRYAVLSCAAPLLFACWWAPQLDRHMTAWNHQNLLDTRDSPYGRITLTSYAGQVSVFENDALTCDSEGTEAEEFVHLAALQHPNPSRVLILGGGIEGTVRETLRHSPKQVDYVELNSVLLSAARAHLGPEVQDLSSTNVRVLIADPRNFLAQAGQYELILIGMPEPSSAQANRFYTSEFFGQCASHLSPGGVIGFRLRSSENVWTPQLRRRNASVYGALRSAFADVEVLPGSINTILASLTPMTRDPALLADRFRERRITTRLVSPAYIRYLYENDRFRQIADILARERAAPNTDARPICYQYTVMLWLSKFMPSLGVADVSVEAALKTPWTTLSLLIPLVFALGRRRPSLRRVLLSASAGFLGMAIESLFILQYQVKSGVLFQDIGLLLMSFMAGLAVGALVSDRVRTQMQQAKWAWRTGLPAGFVAIGSCIILGAPTGLPVTAGLLLGTGFFVAVVFSYAGLCGVQDQKRVIAPLYAADLAGGCLGSLAATLVMIPFAGVKATGAALVVIAVITGILV